MVKEIGDWKERGNFGRGKKIGKLNERKEEPSEKEKDFRRNRK